MSDQVISSATNLAFGLYLLRELVLADFGLFNIGFTAMLFFGALGQGFFLLQMVVHTPDKPASERAKYAARILLLLVLTCAAGLAVAIPSVLLAQAVTRGALGSDRFLIWVGAMSVAYMIKEFHVRHAFNEGRGGRAVAIHATLALALLAGVLVQRLIGQPMTLELAQVLYAGAHTIAVLFGHALAGLRLTGHSREELHADLVEIAGGGRWALTNNIVNFLRGQAHIIAVAALLGPVGVAKINAARLMVTPAILAIPAMSQVALPRLASMAKAGGKVPLMRVQWKIGLGLLVIAVGYSALLLSAWPVLSVVIPGEARPGMFWIVALWCTYSCCLALRNSLEWVTQALGEFRAITAINTISAALVLTAVLVLTNFAGISGAVMSMVFGEVLVIVGLWWFLADENLKNAG